MAGELGGQALHLLGFVAAAAFALQVGLAHRVPAWLNHALLGSGLALLLAAGLAMSSPPPKEGSPLLATGKSACKSCRYVYFLAFCAALNSANLGFDIGVTANVGPLLQIDWNLSNVATEFFIGLINWFAIIGTLIGASVSDRFGRLFAMGLAAALFVLGVKPIPEHPH